MCGKTGLYLLFLLLCLSAGALRAEESWYLISETELRSIETSLDRLEKDRRSWELQARGLKSEAGSLNSQLSEERKQYRALEKSFSEYERDQLNQTATKNGEIADLRQEVSEKTIRAMKAEGTASLRMVIIIALAGAIAAYAAIKIYLKIRWGIAL